MIRAVLVLVGGVVIARFLLIRTVGWLATTRRRPSWTPVAFVVGAVLLYTSFSILSELWQRGLTFYAVVHTVFMGWLALQAVALGHTSHLIVNRRKALVGLDITAREASLIALSDQLDADLDEAMNDRDGDIAKNADTVRRLLKESARVDAALDVVQGRRRAAAAKAAR